jgi:hypothetical protein
MNPTPFPDPATPAQAPASRRRNVLVVLAMTALGGAFGAGIAIGSRAWFKAGATPEVAERLAADGWTLLLLPVVWFACVLAHEAGHLLGGMAGGMRPLMLFAGPLHVDFNADRVRFQRNRVAATWGGLAACAPGGNGGASRRGYLLLVAGGPLASLALAAVAGLLALAIGGWWGGLAFTTAALSLVIGIATLIPLRAGGYMSDGGQLLGLARDDHGTRQRLALGTLMAQSYAGVRARDWDGALLDVLAQPTADATLRAVTAMLQASRAEDQRRFDTADAHWRELAAIVNGSEGATIAAAARGAFALGIAGWIGLRRREGASARRWLDASRGGFSDPAVRAYSEAAVALAEGDAAQARRRLDAARAALPRVTDRGGAIALAESLDDIARDLDTNMTDATAVAAQA